MDVASFARQHVRFSLEPLHFKRSRTNVRGNSIRAICTLGVVLVMITDVLDDVAGPQAQPVNRVKERPEASRSAGAILRLGYQRM